MTATATEHRPGLPGGKYLAIAHIAARQAVEDRAAMVGRVLFQGLILLIFSRLWTVVIADGSLGSHSMRELLWYLAITEWVVLSPPLIHLEIEEDFRSGDVAYRLPRPVSYLGSRIAEGFGTMAVRGSALAVSGFVWASLLSGGLPPDPRGLVLVLPLGILAASLAVVCIAGVGLTALWLQDASPAYWIWQKANFLLGGLMIPLEFYPAWLASIAGKLPFAAMVHGPGHMAFGFAPDRALATAGALLAWGAVITLAVAATSRAGLRRLDVNGG